MYDIDWHPSAAVDVEGGNENAPSRVERNKKKRKTTGWKKKGGG
jgi:hypothetical protein